MSEITREPFDAKRFIGRLTTRPGVYQMLDADGEVIYVGKAKNLKKRVSSYFLRASGSPRTEAMVDRIADIAVNVTQTEDQALVLEANLIKQYKPHYNVLFKDDKSFPYIAISGHEYPRISYHRGARKRGVRYFGPYPGAWAARQTLASLQKLFQLRPCTDTYFANRTRPCLQHQIKRCSAPCVRKISPEDYARDIAHAVQVLDGKGDKLVRQFGEQMEAASQALEFERAAALRDQIANLRRVQAQGQAVSGSRSLDVVLAQPLGGVWGVIVGTVRHGRHMGHRTYYPSAPAGIAVSELLAAFLTQHYLSGSGGDQIPRELIMPEPPDDADWLTEALAKRAGRTVDLKASVRGDRARVVQMARDSLNEAVSARVASRKSQHARFAALAELLDLPEPPQRLECFDISHTRGESAVASCVVFDTDGPLKSAYRRFNIKDVTPGDDYAAIRQAVSRRFARLKSGEAPMPDILFIDGGAGQVTQAVEALAELDVDGVLIAGVSKGTGRRPGLEQLIVPGTDTLLRPSADNPGLHLVQQIRDEAHRFAIQGHRGQRSKARGKSVLESIDGLGPKRRAALLKAFGGLPRIERAGVDELMRVDGVNRALAQRIYERFHA